MRCIILKSNMRFAHGAIWGATLGLIAMIVYWNAAPFGVTYVKDMHALRSSAAISDFTPGDRVTADRMIVRDPVYMLVRPPRRFANAVVEVDGENLTTLRLGVTHDADAKIVALWDAQAPTSTTRAVYLMDLAGAQRDDNGAYRFVFSVSGNAGVRVDAVKVSFQ